MNDEIDVSVFLSKTSFAEYIEKRVQEGQTYFEAVLEFSENCDKSPEELLPFMSQVLIDKLKKSASDLGLINTGDVPLDEFLE
jgi:hypothetical protein